MRRAFEVTVVVVLIGVACRRPAETLAKPMQSDTAAPAAVSAQRRTPVVVAVHNILPSVVNIQTEATIRRRAIDPFFGFFGSDRSYQTQSVGSGFVWTRDGFIVTNAHVIEGASSITVKFQDGRELAARVMGVDPDSDLAVLRVEASNLPAAPMGTSSDLLIGESVIAVGNPFGLSGTVTTGVVSALGRSVPSKDQERIYTDFIQTDASINPGNSGGPLLNLEGKVIGINTAIYAEAQGIGFAIPVDRARKVVEDLRRFGEVHRAWIGAITTTLTPEEAQRLGLRERRGALVTRIFEGSPASRGGLKPGDVIVAIGSSPVDSREAFTTLTESAAEGSRLRIKVRRDEDLLELIVAPATPPRDLGLQVLEDVAGITVADRAEMIVIGRVARGSRAQSIGLEPGDQIVGINGIEVSSVRALEKEIVRAADRSSLVLSIARGRFIYTLTFPMGAGRGRSM